MKGALPDPDLCAAALLGDLAALDDASEPCSAIEREAIARGALETAGWLVELGGGPFELSMLAKIEDALRTELGARR